MKTIMKENIVGSVISPLFIEKRQKVFNSNSTYKNKSYSMRKLIDNIILVFSTFFFISVIVTGIIVWLIS